MKSFRGTLIMDGRFAAEVQKVQRVQRVQRVWNRRLWRRFFITSLNQPALWAEPIGQCIST